MAIATHLNQPQLSVYSRVLLKKMMHYFNVPINVSVIENCHNHCWKTSREKVLLRPGSDAVLFMSRI